MPLIPLRFAAVLLPAACIAISPAAAQTPPVASQVRPPAPAEATRQAVPYLFMAGMSDVFEISSSQVALRRSQDPAVRRFATMLIDHHTRTTNQALAAAQQAGVMPPPPVLDGRHQMIITRLLAVPAAQFDRVFLEAQIPAHREALSLHQGYAAGGDTPQLRATAQAAVPIVQSHLVEAQRLLTRSM